jgi:hypothetical protein
MSNYNTLDLVQYDEHGNLVAAVLKVIASKSDGPIMAVPIRPPMSPMVTSLKDLSYEDQAKRVLFYKKVTQPYMFENGSIYEIYSYELDLEHAVKYLGYMLK